MRVGVDSYSFHRFFGEFREGEDLVETSWETSDFISAVKEMGVDGVASKPVFSRMKMISGMNFQLSREKRI